MWNPVANLDVGLEVAYTKLNTAFAGAAVSAGDINQGLATGRYNIEDQMCGLPPSASSAASGHKPSLS